MLRNAILVLVFVISTTEGFLISPLSRATLLSPRVATSTPPVDNLSRRKEELKTVLEREYLSFFSPFEREYYRNDVEFRDPLTTLKGADNYAFNIEMLGGKNFIGNILFKDANITPHSVTDRGRLGLRTRWTLSFVFQRLPWSPRAIFTGVSDYTLDEEGYIIKQQDYWDSINLKGGNYEQVSKLEGLSDFLGQLKQDEYAMQVSEVPYELFRRAKTYQVRRYPPTIMAKVAYTSRQTGYGSLGAYADGANEKSKKLKPFSPSFVQICDDKDKYMMWPVTFSLPTGQLVPLGKPPAPTDADVELISVPERVVAVSEFSEATTEDYVRFYSSALKTAVEADKLVPSENKVLTVAQYNAIYSLSKRRNEVWIELDKHDWE